MNTKKKGLAVIYDPHNLLQFVWYYATYGKEYEWTALCLPNGYKGEYMSEYCEKSGIFAEIIRSSDDFSAFSLKRKAGIFCSMLAYAVLGKQKKYCRKTLTQYVNIGQFDLAVVLTDVGIISGLVIGLSAEMEVVILEDGASDYFDRKYKYFLRDFTKGIAWEGLLLSLMGYSNPHHYFPLKTTKNCRKFCSKPDGMKYRNYKQMMQLYDYTQTDISYHKKITQRIYNTFDLTIMESSQICLFTTPIDDFVDENEREMYIKKVVKYINDFIGNADVKLLIKKHPRDSAHYFFRENVSVYELDNSIPAEVILPYLQNKTLFFFNRSTIMLNLNYNTEIRILYLKGLKENHGRYDYPSIERVNNYVQMCGLEKCSIEEI